MSICGHGGIGTGTFKFKLTSNSHSFGVLQVPGVSRGVNVRVEGGAVVLFGSYVLTFTLALLNRGHGGSINGISRSRSKSNWQVSGVLQFPGIVVVVTRNVLSRGAQLFLKYDDTFTFCCWFIFGHGGVINGIAKSRSKSNWHVSGVLQFPGIGVVVTRNVLCWALQLLKTSLLFQYEDTFTFCC